MNISYTRSGDFFIPDLQLTEGTQPIGKWGRMHRDYLKEHHPTHFNSLLLSVSLWTYLADLNEQAQQRVEILVFLPKTTEGITEALQASHPIAWTQHMSIEEYTRIVKAHVEAQGSSCGDGESVPALLYEAYNEVNTMDDSQIKTDFHKLYELMNGMPMLKMDKIIYPVCTLCRDHQCSRFVDEIKVGFRLSQELVESYLQSADTE